MGLPRPAPGLAPLAETLLAAVSSVGWMRRRRSRYGDVFSAPLSDLQGGRRLCGPALVKQAFTDDPAIFQAGEANALALGDALGEHSLLTLDQDRQLSDRKLLLPPSHGESVRRYADVLADAAAAEVERWPLGRPFAPPAAHARDRRGARLGPIRVRPRNASRRPASARTATGPRSTSVRRPRTPSTTRNPREVRLHSQIRRVGIYGDQRCGYGAAVDRAS